MSGCQICNIQPWTCYSNDTDTLHQLGLGNLANQRPELHRTLLFKIIHWHVYISLENLGFTKPDHHTCAKNLNTHMPPPKNCNFTNHIISDWNFLSASLSQLTSVPTFKLGWARLERISGQFRTSLTSSGVILLQVVYFTLLMQIQIEIFMSCTVHYALHPGGGGALPLD